MGVGGDELEGLELEYKERADEPIKFSEMKTARKGLLRQDNDVNYGFETRSNISEIQSTSFWNWYGTCMKGPINVNAQMKMWKKALKLDLSGKHPVSALIELCCKLKWKELKFTLELSSSGFQFKVEVNGNPLLTQYELWYEEEGQG